MDGVGDGVPLFVCDFRALSQGRDFGDEECFVGVDVADACDDGLVEQCGFDGAL